MSDLLTQPLISVIMANFNGGRYLAQALTSVLSQSYPHLEIILVDDGSSDDSVEIATRISKTDPRLKVFSGSRFGGPAPVRNFAINQASGDWIAIVDSDDHIHPDRFLNILKKAHELQADIIIDDLLVFNDANLARPSTLFSGQMAKDAGEIPLVDYVQANCLYGRGSGLGYAKPLIKRQCLDLHNMRYDETMRIGEDYDLVYRLMRTGCRLYSVPDIFYFYRKHATSISHRLDAESLRGLLVSAQTALGAPDLPRDLASALKERLRSIERAMAFDTMVRALKGKTIGTFIKTCIAVPSAIPLLAMPITDRFRTRLARPRAQKIDIAVIARQRVVGATNGSSAYLLALCNYLTTQGLRVGIYWPSPETFGRWPVLTLKPDMAFLADLDWRGGKRIGRYVFSTSLKTYWSFFLTAVEAVLLKLKVIRTSFVPRALSALKAPLRREDYLFLADKLKSAKAVIADYAFCTPYLAYRLDSTPSLVLMHDLFSSRPEQFTDTNIKDDYGQFTFDEEIAHLAKAGAVIAIQSEEAEKIRPYLPKTPVIISPMSSQVVDAAQVGNSHTLLFVGSSAAPNVIGLEWFLSEVWPSVLSQLPNTVLKVAGTVGRSIASVPRNVDILGLVDDLQPLYAEAGVVISPLTTGSGLKIKIVEALAQGKACVVTPVTLQGITGIVGDAVETAEDSSEFADAIKGLLTDKAARMRVSEKALDCARRNFSADGAFNGVYQFISDETSHSPRRAS